jgi:hypothetical protein
LIYQLGKDPELVETLDDLFKSKTEAGYKAGMKLLKKHIAIHAPDADEKPETVKKPVISKAPPPSKTQTPRSQTPDNTLDVLTTTDFAQYEKMRAGMPDRKKRA